MNETIKLQLEHRSIRKWKDTPINKATIKQLYEVANRTASSTAMQQFSVIRVKNKETRKKLANLSKQAYMEEAPELFVFIVDCFRNYSIMKEQGFDLETANDDYRFIQGYTDGVLAAQNMTTAIESLGMGAVYFGSILSDLKQVIKLLKLPKLTMPIFAVGFGYPDQAPELKPRIDIENKFFDEEYKIYPSYLEMIKSYDKVLNTYYDLRDTTKTVPTFSKQVIERLSANMLKDSYLKVAREQGFDL